MTEDINKREKRVKGLSSFRMEASRRGGGLSLILSGIIGISDFADDLIYLKGHSGRIIVHGSKLFINVYENENVEIVGKVEGMEFKYGKN